jgi:hypothetical protein
MRKLDPEKKALWVAALRSGEYPQGRDHLATKRGDGTFAFCCLGVACEVAIKNGLPLSVREDVGMRRLYGGLSSYPPFEVSRWLTPADETIKLLEDWEVTVPALVMRTLPAIMETARALRSVSEVMGPGSATVDAALERHGETPGRESYSVTLAWLNDVEASFALIAELIESQL